MQPIPSIRARFDAAAKGTRFDGFLPIGTMASGAEFGISFVVLKGASNGKCLWINGQVHGDEINGILAAHDFLNGLDPSRLRGSIVLSSSANPLALDARHKNAPQDGYDMDQSFPGQPHGFVTERAAHLLMQQITEMAPDLIINMHTMPTFMASEPYAVFKRDNNDRISEQTLLQYIAPFRPRMACLVSVEPGRGERIGNLAGALDHQMLTMGIPCFMLELGSGGKATAAHIEQGIAGFADVARQMHIIEGEPEVFVSLTKVTQRARVTFPQGGLFRANKQPGDVVAAGETIGRIIDLRGRELEALSLPYEHMLIGIRSDPVVHTGDWFCFVAKAWETVEL